jgi:hypothetical protein
MPAKTAQLDAKFFPDEEAEYEVEHNPGRNLAHPKFLHHKVVQKGPPPTVFDHVDADYPAAKVLKIATTFKDSLLKDLKLEDHSFRQSFVSPPGATSLSKGSGLAQLMRKKPLSK